MDLHLEKNDPETKEYGGFWIRFGAYLLDSIILGIPLMILTFVILFAFLGSSGVLDAMLADPEYMESTMTDNQAMKLLGGYLLAVLLNFIITIAYYAGMHASKWQGTIGKKLLGLKVTDMNGQRISFWRGLGRYIAMVFLSAIFMIGYIMAAFTAKKQSLHDMIAGTIVIKDK
ncbi:MULTISPECIES: RDD family protein [unclassified Bacillus (in: firmicutes)]|uniref:RDD family protein n=1 Tax=unclassified Bacillus (in: firmicutes) TaxID=185979 RepID=UPI0008E8E230|nr:MULTISPECIES: RDD family protein [unclassified Bacillus (in: firmicutes)]SFA76910.1 Uncharacterized membrane protein YckC, RDD family [Bacillus sp. UNCCL13]SFQ66780.1 Uncharacterized membrane protein YckC, RDD family [Bacillus sp. cl95]